MKTNSIWSACLGVLSRALAAVIAALFLGAALSLSANAATAPADASACIASAQNRSVPLTPTGDFALNNLPGNGFVPFATSDAQPFRIRVTCSDGTVGETALTFPLFEQSLVETGAIIWGQSTPVPTQLRLDLPSYVISPANPDLAGQVTARYADGTEKVVTARTAGTGYRSSSAGFVGVSNDGRVYLQAADTLSLIAGRLPVPSIITITAENDGVVSSRLVQLVSTGTLSGRVTQADGRDARGLEVRLSIAGYDDLLATTDPAGDYRFSSLPFAVSRYADLLVLDRVNRRVGSTRVWLDANGNGLPSQIVLQGAGMVRISVVDAAGAPQAGVSVGVSDSYSRALGLVPSTLASDASGQAAFRDVPAGTVMAISSAAGYAAAPGRVLLAAGAVAAITLRANGASPASQAAIVGQVLQRPSLTGAVGATIELLENKLGAAPMRQVVDGSGRFSFAGLPVSTLFNYQVKMGAEVLASGDVYTDPVGGQRALNIELPAQRGLSGIVVSTDGVTLAPGVAVQLSYFDNRIQTWTAASTITSRVDGSFIWRYLEPRRYRLQALVADGSSATIEVDLSNAPPASMQNNLRLQLASKPAQVKLGLRATVLGAADFGSLGAELFVRNSSCTSWCAMGQLPTTTEALTTDFLGQGHNDFELRWSGRVQAFAIDVGPANDGQTVSRVIDFGPDASGVNRIPAQRSLYSFNVAQGSRIYAAVLGRAQNGGAAAAAVKYELYDPSGQLLAQGRGFDPARTPNAASQAVKYAAAPMTGRYTLVVSPLNADAGNLGGYGLLTNVADLVVVPQPWAAAGPARFGGQAAGRVFQFSGAPAPGTPVVVSAGPAGKLQLVEQVIAAADGSYTHLNLPLGPVVLEATDADGAVFARVQGSLQADGERVVQDLHMAARTRVGLSLHLSPGSIAASGGTAKVAVVDAFNNREVMLQVPAGALDGTVQFAVAGDQGTLKIGHPGNGLLIAERTVTGSDGTLVAVDVTMPTGRVPGKVLAGTGEAVDQVLVSALNSGGAVIGRVSSGADGSFVFLALPANTALRVQASDVVLGVSATADVATVEAADVSSGDLVLPTASISGYVKTPGGTPLVGDRVDASFAGGTILTTTTDPSGRYALARVPAGRVVSITASDLTRGKSRPVTTQGAVGERITAPDIIFHEGATVQGRLRTASGRPLANVRVSITRRGTGSLLDAVHTDAAGNYTFYNVPQLDATVSALWNYTVGWLERSSNVLVSGATGTQVVPDLIFADTASLRLRVVDPMGNAVSGLAGWPATLDLLWSSGGFRKTVPLPAPGGDLYESLASGDYRAEWTSSSGVTLTARETLTAGSMKNLDVVVPLLRGRVVHSDGSPVNSGEVWMNQGEGPQLQTILGKMGGPEVPGGTPVPNSFVIAPVELGGYTITAQDWVTGLERSWRGRFTSLPSESMTLVMPGTARVEGCVTAADGSSTKPGTVRLISPASGVAPSWVAEMSAKPNDAGCFSFPKVPTGDVILQVESGGWREPLLAVQRMAIPPSANNTTVQANVRYPVLGNVKCLTPAAESLAATETIVNTLVPLSVEQSLNDGAYVYPSLNLVAGNCLQQKVLPGKYRAEQIVHDDNGPVRGHVLELQIGSGQEFTGQLAASITPPIGSRWNVLPVPVGASTYSLDGRGWGSNGQVNALENTGSEYEALFFDTAGLLLNGLSLPNRELMLAKPAAGSREFAIGPYEQGNGIRLTRRMFVPDTGGYMRLIETVTNNSNETQTVKLEIMSPARRYCRPDLIVGVNDDGQGSGYVGYQDCEGAVLHVYAGVGAASSQRVASEPGIPERLGGVKAQWSMTLTPGQSGAIMHFVLAAPLGDRTLGAIIPRAKALTQLGDVKMLQELTAADRSLIKNFTVGQ